ncbi:MAG: RodZ domain-containing protein, partial [Actinomycetes bacterium]
RNLTLQQVEEDTKIRVKYVQAMENEDWDVMPGVTYVKGFLRTYASYLGLDPDVIIDEFRSRGMSPAAEHHEPFSGSSVIGKPRSHRGRNTIVIVAVICLLVLGVIYVLGMRSNKTDEPGTRPGALGISSASPKASTSPKPSSSTSAVPAWQKNLVKLTAAKGDCWMEVRRDSSTGIVLFSGTVKKGDHQKFTGKVLWISFGNPAVVQLEVQGKKVKVTGDVGPWPVIVNKGHVTQGPATQG